MQKLLQAVPTFQPAAPPTTTTVPSAPRATADSSNGSSQVEEILAVTSATNSDTARYRGIGNTASALARRLSAEDLNFEVYPETNLQEKR
jgi:hypothetical protein